MNQARWLVGIPAAIITILCLALSGRYGLGIFGGTAAFVVVWSCLQLRQERHLRRYPLPSLAFGIVAPLFLAVGARGRSPEYLSIRVSDFAYVVMALALGAFWCGAVLAA